MGLLDRSGQNGGGVTRYKESRDRVPVLSQTVTQQMVTLGTKQQPPVTPYTPMAERADLNSVQCEFESH